MGINLSQMNTFKVALPVPVAPELVFQVRLVIIIVSKGCFAFNPIYNKTIDSCGKERDYCKLGGTSMVNS